MVIVIIYFSRLYKGAASEQDDHMGIIGASPSTVKSVFLLACLIPYHNCLSANQYYIKYIWSANQHYRVLIIACEPLSACMGIYIYHSSANHNLLTTMYE